MSDCGPFDGLAVVEMLCGLTAEVGGSLTATGQVQACRHPIVHPGPCKGYKRGTPPLKTPGPRRPLKSKGGVIKRLSPEEVSAREARIESVVNDNWATHSTSITKKLPDGSWRPERDRVHREIANAMYAKAATVPREGRAVIAGGLVGSGKAAVLRDHAGVEPGEYFTVSGDDVKEEMAKRGMVPGIDGHEDLSPMERVGLIQQEASRIAELLAAKAYADRRNMVWDLAMSHEGAVQPQIDALRRAGYDDVRSVFVDVPADKALDRVMARYRDGLADWERGEGLGGRFIPAGIIRAQATPDGSTVNRRVFDRVKDQFDDWSVYDNSVDGRAPKIIDRKG